MAKKMVHWIEGDEPLPPSHLAQGIDGPAPGLLAVGGRLTPARLDEAYRRGIFPWFSTGQPVLWWSPDPRMVLKVADFKLHRSLAKTLRRFAITPGCEVRIDSAFERVISACANTPRDGQAGTWIVADMVRAYLQWQQQGSVHSFETWVDGELVGGLYGVGIGRMFFGESMFAHRTDASKIALAALVCFCREHGIEWIDCQQRTSHLASVGAREVPRGAFEAHLERTTARSSATSDVLDWTYHPRLWAHLLAPGSPDPQAL